VKVEYEASPAGQLIPPALAAALLADLLLGGAVERTALGVPPTIHLASRLHPMPTLLSLRRPALQLSMFALVADQDGRFLTPVGLLESGSGGLDGPVLLAEEGEVLLLGGLKHASQLINLAVLDIDQFAHVLCLALK
jgi:hypothetical protein